MTTCPSEIVKYIPAKYREMLPAPPHLGEVAMLFREMPYGEMMRFCKATGADPEFVWEWANGRL